MQKFGAEIWPRSTMAEPARGHRVLGESDASSVKLSDLVYAKIAGRIRSGEYPLDARLPTENDLAEMLGVSRPVIREALARLRNDGVVTSRRGSGTYVQRAMEAEPGRVAPLSSISDMRRCLEYRLSMEGEAAWHAAQGSPDDRGQLHEAMAQLTRDLEAHTMQVDDDFAFHLGIAQATGNRFFATTMEGLRTSIITAMGITPSFMTVRTHDRLSMLMAEHRAVYDAIVANKPDAARAAMRDHLTRAMRRVFEGVDS